MKRIRPVLAILGVVAGLWAPGFLGPNPFKKWEAERIQATVLEEIKAGMRAGEVEAILIENGFAPIRIRGRRELGGRRELPSEFIGGLPYERAIVFVATFDAEERVVSTEATLEIFGL